MNLSPAMGDCGATSGVGVSMASGFVTVVGIIRVLGMAIVPVNP